MQEDLVERETLLHSFTIRRIAMNSFLLGFALYAGLDGQYPDAVRFDDVERFPHSSKSEIEDNLAFGQEYYDRVCSEMIAASEDKEWFEPYIAEVVYSLECWKLLYISTGADWEGLRTSWDEQLAALRQLRNLLGKRDYYRGRMPPIVPPTRRLWAPWRF